MDSAAVDETGCLRRRVVDPARPAFVAGLAADGAEAASAGAVVDVLASYRESQAVGERVLLVSRSVADVGPDFWLFDENEPDAHAVVMRYNERGQWLGADLVMDPNEVRGLAERLHAVAAGAMPLNEFLVGVC